MWNSFNSSSTHINSYYILLQIEPLLTDLKLSCLFHSLLFSLIQHCFWCSVSSVLSRPLHLVSWQLLRNLLIQAVILKKMYSSYFSNKLSNVSELSIVVVTISLVALHSTWDYAVGLMVGWRGHNERFESQVGPFHQRSANSLIGLPRLPMSMNSWLKIFLTLFTTNTL